MASSGSIVISLGGSVIMPGRLDEKFVRSFVSKIKGDMHHFVIITGGGQLARDFQRIARESGVSDDKLLDEVGIQATRVNAAVLQGMFGDGIVDSRFITDPSKKRDLTHKVTLGHGWRPGFSTDHCSVTFAIKNGIKDIVNISNTRFVYDKDPKKFPDAKPLRSLDWKRMQELVGTKWSPGLNAPFDPLATKLAREKKLKVVFLGPDPANFGRYLKGDRFEGTIIE